MPEADFYFLGLTLLTLTLLTPGLTLLTPAMIVVLMVLTAYTGSFTVLLMLSLG